jgi:HK97 family phage major capsid protein
LKTLASRRYGRGIETALLLGLDSAGTVLPNQSAGGIIASAVTTNSAVAATVSADDLEALFESLNEAYHPNAIWLMNQATRNAIGKLKDSTNRYLLQPNPATGSLNMLWGRPVVLAASAPSIATGNIPVLFGDLQSGYFLFQNDGLRISTTTERYADLNEGSVIISAAVGGCALVSGAIAGLKIS